MLYMKTLKRRKWYSNKNVKPDCEYGLIVMTDMGYVFEASFKNGIWSLLVSKDYKAYFVVAEYQDSIIKWMKY